MTGPWRTQCEVEVDPPINPSGEYRRRSTWPIYSDGGKFEHICTCEKEEHARLIAAAPELLEALELVWNKVLSEYHSKDSYVRLKTEAAIDKAYRVSA